MQIDKPGFYKTQSGHRAEVLGKNSCGNWVGYVFGDLGAECWAPENGVNVHSVAYNLIAEWREPVSLPVYLYQHGDDPPFLSREETNNACCRLLAKGRITEGEGLD